MTMWARRWLRRGAMICLYAALWVVICGLSPVLVVLLGGHDVVRRNRGAGLRLVVMLWIFLLAELGGIALASLLWLRHALSAGRAHDRFIDDHFRLQHWWGDLLLRTCAWLLQLRLSVEGDDQVMPGPVVVLMRHTSVVDTILPLSLLCQRHGLRLRYVLKKGLQLDPCLDIVGNRLPNYFVDRSGETEHEVAEIGRLAEGLGPRDGVLIYPEGTRFTPEKLTRARTKLEQREPLLHELSQDFGRVLPPRPGGTLALLSTALPAGADVLVLAHAGLEDLSRMHDVVSGKVIGATVRVRMWRIPGSQIPAEREAQLRWLYEQWAKVDAFASEGVRPSPRGT